MNLKMEAALYDTLPVEIKAYLKDAAVTVIKSKARSSVLLIQTCEF